MSAPNPLTPRSPDLAAPMYDDIRLHEIIAAVYSYLGAGLAIPAEWAEEYRELLERRREREGKSE